MKHLLTKVSSVVVLAAALLLTSGCYREIEERIDVVDQEITKLDNQMEAMEKTLSSLSSLYASVKDFDDLKDFANTLRSDLDEFQNILNEKYATTEIVGKVRSLAIDINTNLESFRTIVNGHINGSEKDIEDLKSALQAAEDSLAELSKLIYFSMEIVPEALVNGAPAVLFNSDSPDAVVSVTLEVNPAARAEELKNHITFSIVPVSTLTRASGTYTLEGKKYELSGNLLTVTAQLPKQAPFIDEDKNWNVKQAFVISARYVDDKDLILLSTPYISAFLTSASSSETQKTVSLILGKKDSFWEAVAKGATDAAKLDNIAVSVTYCNNENDQSKALQELLPKEGETAAVNGIIIYPISKTIEETAAIIQTRLDVPVVVVDKELEEDSALAEKAKTQVVLKETPAIQALCGYITDDDHEDVLIISVKNSTVSPKRSAAAKESLSGITTREFSVNIDEAVSTLSSMLEAFTECTALIILDDELITSDVLEGAEDLDVYVFGTVPAIKTGVANGDITVGMFKDGIKFGEKGYESLSKATVANPCLIEPETVLLEPEEED